MQLSLPTLVRRFRLVPLLLALVSSACTVCARREAIPRVDEKPDSPKFTLVFTAAQVGYLEPCGCSPDQRGGVARAATVVDEIRAEGTPVLLVDGGDRFFPAATPGDELAARQTKMQAEAMARVTRAMKYDAIVLTSRDAGAGASFFGSVALPPVLDTGETALPGTRSTMLKDVGRVKVGLLAVGEGDNAASILKARAAQLRAQGAQVVVATVYRTLEETRALSPVAKEAGVDFLLSSRADVPDVHEAAALADLQPPIFSPNARGEGLLRLDIVASGRPGEPFEKVAGTAEREEELDAIQQRIDNMRENVVSLGPDDPMRKLQTEKLLDLESRKASLAKAPPPAMPADANAFTYAFVPMTPQLAQSPNIRGLVDAYDRSVAEENLAYATAHPTPCPKAARGEAQYVGAQTCMGCHSAAYAFWEKTSHARAYATLEEKDKQFNVDCISCHVTGWKQPQGACSIAQVEGRRNVQCESCHGAGSLHAATGDPELISLRVPETTCISCHDAVNSPHFNPATYRPRILGPGHGAPFVGGD